MSAAAPSPEVQIELVGEAARAPSAHNTQPARWRFTTEGHVLLFEDRTRRLAVSDPTGRDQRVGLGAAFEGLRLALSRRGLGLTDPQLVAHGTDVPLRLVARSDITAGNSPDPLLPYVDARSTFRGQFLPPDDRHLTGLRQVLDGADVIPVYDTGAIGHWAEVSDMVTFRFLARPEYQAELYQWIRFSARDHGWSRDGLTADCLGLSRPERLAGRWLLEPGRFATLARLGWHRPLVREASRTRSATALAIFHRPESEDPLTAGRRFYRLWLEITRAGFSARPMSALADDEHVVAQLRERHRVPGGSSVINVFAIGRAAPDWVARSPRLPPSELLV
jgi:nitroreductase